MAGLGGNDGGVERATDTTSSNNGEEKVVVVTEKVELSWGTLEELLLACAVIRHGTSSWESIAIELQRRIKRTSNPNYKHNHHQNTNNLSSNTVLTPDKCKQKYIDLKRRFNIITTVGGGSADDDGRDDGEDGGGEEVATDKLLCMVDELKKLRVEELRREVQHHDSSIESLQSKVKRLEEERENNLKAKAVAEEEEVVPERNSDLKSKPEENEKLAEPERSVMEKEMTVKSISGEGSYTQREDGSFNESNSTNNKGGEVDNQTSKAATREKTGRGETESKPERSETIKDEPDRVRSISETEPALACSSGDGVDGKSFANGNRRDGRVEVEVRHPNRHSEAGELRESVSESKRGGGDVTRQQHTQSSEVQSSVSLLKRKKRSGGGGGGSWKVGLGWSSGDEEMEEPTSPTNKRMGVKSQPLIRFMEMLRSHKHGSVFERRLPSQETEKYQHLIQEHVDLDSIQSKLDKGIYSKCHLRFYRDLLLVFTNAIIFYRKNSAEHQAARELRRLVISEIAHKNDRSKHEPMKKPDPKTPLPQQQQLLDPVVKKPRSTSMVVCRRRVPDQSSHKKEEDSVVEMESKREEQMKPRIVGEPPKKPSHAQPNIVDDHKKGGLKKFTRQRSSLEGRKNVAINSKKNKEIKYEVKGKKVDSSSDEEEEEREGTKKEKLEKLLTGSKKQGAANFLKRIKQNSPARESLAEKKYDEESDAVLEKRTDSKNGNINGGTSHNNNNDDTDNKKKYSRKEEAKRTSGRRISTEREVLERGGRPPKRKAAMPNPPESPTVKRRRDTGGGGGDVAKKKSRR